MNIFDQYGIKEVADVTLYSIQKKNDGGGGVYYVPSLYLDTLKISSVDKTAESVWAEGGLGNSRLICWDYGKTIDIKLEDALCTPASLGLCWGGALNADWNNNQIKISTGLDNQIERFKEFQKALYPKANKKEGTICNLLPHTSQDLDMTGYVIKSTILDNTIVKGIRYCNNRVYNWKLYIDSNNKSINQIPNKFFDVLGKGYKIDQSYIPKRITLPTYSNYKDAVIYKIWRNPKTTNNTTLTYEKEVLSNHVVNIDNKAAATDIQDSLGTIYNIKKTSPICLADYLAIIVDKHNNYHALIGIIYENINKVVWTYSQEVINTNQFKDLDMWIEFDNLNELSYFLLTKYESDIIKIKDSDELWAYVNPHTLKPYDDVYWLHQGEAYYKLSLTLSKVKSLGDRILVKAGEFPGMYMFEGTTWIRSKEDGKNKRILIRIPMCKVMSENSLALEAGGEPVVFNLNMQAALPKNGILMELIPYETRNKMVKGEDNKFYILDGSTQIMSE